MATPKQALIAQRKQARHYLVQAVYQWHMAGADASQIEAEFLSDYDMGEEGSAYFSELLRGVLGSSAALQEQFKPLLDRELSELDPVELSLLEVGAYELQHRIDVPFKVVINEAVALAKKFGASDGHRFINGVLDKLALSMRATEVEHASTKQS